MALEITCADALDWGADPAHHDLGAVVTSIPDATEIGKAPNEEYERWFDRAVLTCLRLTRPECPAVFCQTDRKGEGKWMSKAERVITIAREVGHELLWHKIVLRRGVNQVDLHRPTYSHLLAVSRRCGPGTPTPDVIELGRRLYDNGTGLNAARLAVTFALKTTSCIIDPFCGRGTVPVLAHHLGATRAIGIDIDPQQCEHARRLTGDWFDDLPRSMTTAANPRW